jgi:4a-hydroxytetrahydrobiopterin dehydratase
MEKLKDKTCIPCNDKELKPLEQNEAKRLFVELIGWEFSKDIKSLVKEMIFKDFDKAMDFVNMVADLAEFEGHHPDIDIRYNKVKLVLTTHSIKGLSRNDFILAAKIDRISL